MTTENFIAHKAESIGDMEVPDGIIVIEKKMPRNTKQTFETRQGKIKDVYKADAEDIYDVLAMTLPRGTLHQLLIVMLQESATLYIGPAKRKESK